jgi:hypothetical protein
MFTTPPLAIPIAELHLGHHSRRCLSTGAARSAALARMFSKKNKKNRGGLSWPPQRFFVLLFISFLYNIDTRFTGFYFYPPHQTARSTLFDR